MPEFLYKGGHFSGDGILIGQGEDAEIRIPNKGLYKDRLLAVIRQVEGVACLIRLDGETALSVNGKPVQAFAPLREGDIIEVDGETVRCRKADAGKQRKPWLLPVLTAAFLAVFFIGIKVENHLERGIGEAQADALTSSLFQIRCQQVLLQSLQGDTYVTLDSLPAESHVGTGFLSSDGRFITARHVAEPWMNPVDTLFTEWSVLVENANRKARKDSLRLITRLMATCPDGTVFSFQTDSAHINRSRDRLYNAGTRQRPRWRRSIVGVYRNFECELGDVAWFSVPGKGQVKLADERQFSAMKRGQGLLFIGCRTGRDGRLGLNPTIGRLKQAPQWTPGCIFHESNFDNGDSGGPVLARIRGRIVAVGIISRKDPDREIYSGWSVPVKELANEKP